MTNPASRRASALVAIACAVLLGGCSAGHPPPGPIDLVREIFDPNYDYRYADRDRDDAWSERESRASCSTYDLACSHEGRTICCSRSDGCCAGDDGPYCCNMGHARSDGDRDWDWND